MNSDNDTERTLKNGGKDTSGTPSIVLLNRKLGPLPAPRMLTPYEVALLRQCAREVAKVTHEVLANRDNT